MKRILLINDKLALNIDELEHIQLRNNEIIYHLGLNNTFQSVYDTDEIAKSRFLRIINQISQIQIKENTKE